eukprot:989786-Alexandrium_andersonii.AAC.1
MCIRDRRLCGEGLASLRAMSAIGEWPVSWLDGHDLTGFLLRAGTATPQPRSPRTFCRRLMAACFTTSQMADPTVSAGTPRHLGR